MVISELGIAAVKFVAHVKVAERTLRRRPSCRGFGSVLISWRRSGMTVAHKYKSSKGPPCHFWSEAMHRAPACIMKKSEGPSTSTVMDVLVALP